MLGFGECNLSVGGNFGSPLRRKLNGDPKPQGSILDAHFEDSLFEYKRHSAPKSARIIRINFEIRLEQEREILVNHVLS